MRAWKAGLGCALGAVCVWLGAASASVLLEEKSVFENLPVSLRVWGETPEAAGRASREILRELERVDALFSSRRPGSAVGDINQHAGQTPVRVPEEVLRVLVETRKISEATQGAFDITVAACLWQYGFDPGNAHAPDLLRLRQLAPLVNYKNVTLDPGQGTVVFKRDGMQIDLGDALPLYALRRAQAAARGARVQAAWVKIGNHLAVTGTPPGGGPWEETIPDRRKPGGILARIRFSSGILLQASDSDQWFSWQGRRYHSILNPATGEPVQETRQTALLLPDSSGRWLTPSALMVLPWDRAVRLVAEIPGAEAMRVDPNRAIFLTPGWQAQTRPDSEFKQ